MGKDFTHAVNAVSTCYPRTQRPRGRVGNGGYPRGDNGGGIHSGVVRGVGVS
jgi:hypothetical protein